VGQLWLFWVAPLVGAALAGMVYRWVGGAEPAPVPVHRFLSPTAKARAPPGPRPRSACRYDRQRRRALARRSCGPVLADSTITGVRGRPVAASSARIVAIASSPSSPASAGPSTRRRKRRCARPPPRRGRPRPWPPGCRPPSAFSSSTLRLGRIVVGDQDLQRAALRPLRCGGLLKTGPVGPRLGPSGRRRHSPAARGPAAPARRPRRGCRRPASAGARSSVVASRAWARPATPFSGVRSSWLMSRGTGSSPVRRLGPGQRLLQRLGLQLERGDVDPEADGPPSEVRRSSIISQRPSASCLLMPVRRCLR